METAFGRQLAALLPRLSRFALVLTRSRQEADDLTQAACERALGRIGQWQPDTRLDSWMFRIMQTIWLNDIRARKVREAHADQLAPAAEATDAAERALQARLMLDKVAAAALRLPEEQRIVLLLVCIEGFTYREAAEIAGIPIGTVMSRLARARLSLMAMIGEAGGGSAGNVIQMESKWQS
ncbi:MAG TPA: RNA polymerase sigma factor [Acetobacteraceae bacterium]|nr:RNA polymerase sigma factor [Acetobacteraceae bacterium]